jgi:hypothetical protein
VLQLLPVTACAQRGGGCGAGRRLCEAVWLRVSPAPCLTGGGPCAQGLLEPQRLGATEEAAGVGPTNQLCELLLLLLLLLLLGYWRYQYLCRAVLQ